MKERAKDATGYPIDHNEMRFRKIIELQNRPAAGDRVPLTTRSGRVLHASVVRVDLDEARAVLVLSCQYAERRITPDDYTALATDPDWQLKHLLE
jgi:hypothetical protein